MEDPNDATPWQWKSESDVTTVTEHCIAKRLLQPRVASTWKFHLLSTRLSWCTRTPRTLRLRKALPQTMTMIGASFPLLLYYPPNAAGVPASPKWPRLAEVTTKIRENKMARRRPEWNLWKYTAGVPILVTERPKVNVQSLASWNCRFESRRRHVSLLWVLCFFW